MSIRAQTIRRMSLSQPGGPTPDAVPAVERTGVVASAVGGREDRTGQMIGKSLSALAEFAQRVDQRKDEIEITRFTTQLETETAGLAQQVRSEVEPNQVPQQYWEQHKAVTERVIDQTDDPDVRMAIGQAATKQRAQNFSQLVRQVDVDQRRMLYNEYDAKRQLKLQQYAEADTPEEREAVMEQVRQINQRIKDSNAITPSGEQWTQAELDLANRNAVQQGNAMRAETLLAQERFNEVGQLMDSANLSPDTRNQIRRTLRAERRRIANQGMRRMRQAMKISAVSAGSVGAEQAEQAADAVLAHGTETEQKQAAAMLHAIQMSRKMRDATIPEFNERINELRSDPDMRDVEAVSHLVDIAQMKQNEFEQQPHVSAANHLGLDVPELPGADATSADFEEYAARMDTLATEAERVLGPGNTVGVLPDAAASAISTRIKNPETDASQELLLLNRLKETTDPERWTATVNQFENYDQVVAGAVFLAGESTELATHAISGRQIQEAETDMILPDEDTRATKASSVIGNSLPGDTQSVAGSALEKTALAVAISRNQGSREVTGEQYKQALNDVIAGKRLPGSGFVGDGGFKLNGYDFLNPVRGATADYVRGTWDNAGIEDIERYRAAGVVGRPQMDAGDGSIIELDSSSLDGVRLEPVDFNAGIYRLTGVDGGPLLDAQGQPYEINLRDLLLDPDLAAGGVSTSSTVIDRTTPAAGTAR